MQLWTYIIDHWERTDIGPFPMPDGGKLFDLLLCCGITSSRDTPDTEPYRLVVFSPEECKTLGMLGEYLFAEEPAMSLVSSLIALAVENRGMIDSENIPDAFPWAKIYTYEEDGDPCAPREHDPNILCIENGAFVLTPTEGVAADGIAIDLDGRLTDALIQAHQTQDQEVMHPETLH